MFLRVCLGFLLLAASFAPAKAQTQDPGPDCSPYPDVPVDVTPVFDRPAYDFMHSIGQIRSLSDDGQHSIHEGIPLGLTYYHPILEITISTRTLEYPDGTTCAVVDHVDAKVGYRDVTVYVADEIPQDSCGFTEVMAHEQKHIAVNLDILNRYAPLIQQRLKDYLRENGMFREENYDYAVQMVHDRMQSILAELGGQLTNDNDRQQRQVDSQDEYRRISVSCGGQLQGVVQRYMRNGD